MTEKKSDFQATLEQLMAGERQEQAPLDAEQIFAYYEAEQALSETEKTAYIERFLADPEAAKALLRLKTFSPEEAPAMDAAELENSWQAFRQELEETQTPPIEPPSSPIEPPSSPSRARHFPFLGGLAAALLLACSGLSLWTLALKRELTQIARSHKERLANIEKGDFLTLDAGLMDIYLDKVFRSGELEKSLTHRKETLFIHLDEDAPTYPQYRLEIKGESLSAPQVLEGPPKDGNRLILHLDRRGFPGEQYEIELAGLKNGNATLLGRFRLNWKNP